MTLGAFKEHLLANECDLTRVGSDPVYKIINRNSPSFEAFIDYHPDTKKLKPAIMCLICQTLRIPIPNAIEHAKEVVETLKDDFDGFHQKLSAKRIRKDF